MNYSIFSNDDNYEDCDEIKKKKKKTNMDYNLD